MEDASTGQNDTSYQKCDNCSGRRANNHIKCITDFNSPHCFHKMAKRCDCSDSSRTSSIKAKNSESFLAREFWNPLIVANGR